MCSGEFLIKRLKFSKSRRVLNFSHWHLAGRGSIFLWTWSREQFLWLVSWFSVSFGGYLYGCICCHSILEGQNLAKVIDLIVPCFSTSWQLIVCSYTDHPDASGPATHHHAQPNQMSDYFSEKVSDSRTKSDSNAHVKRLQLCLPWPHQTKKIH